MKIQRYGLGREYAGNTGSPAITEQADGAYVRYEDFQRMDAGHNAMHDLLVLRTRKAEAVAAGTLINEGTKAAQPDHGADARHMVEPSDDDIRQVMVEFGAPNDDSSNMAYDKHEIVAGGRALLARYGSARPSDLQRAVEEFQVAEQACAQRHSDAGNLIEPAIAVEAGLLAAAPFLAAPPADGPAQQESIHLPQLRHAIADIAEQRHKIELMEDQLGGNVWLWEPEGENHLESMGNRMGVLIYACDLKAPLAQAQQDADKVGAQPTTDATMTAAQEYGYQRAMAAKGKASENDIKLAWDAFVNTLAQPEPAMAGNAGLLGMIETLCNGLEWNIENHPEIMNESDAEALAQARALLKRVQPAIGGDAKPDMFWNADDPEQCQDSIHNLLVEMQGNRFFYVGDIVEVQQAVKLPNISVRITSAEDDEGNGDMEYEVIDAAMQQGGQS